MAVNVDRGTTLPTTKQSITTTAAAIGTDTSLFSGGVDEVVLSCPSANTDDVLLGDSTVTNAGGGKVFAVISKGGGIVLTGGLSAVTTAVYAVAVSGTQTLFVGGRRTFQ